MIQGIRVGQLVEITAVIVSIIGSILIVKKDWKKYGLLYLTSSVVGSILCFLFVSIGFYYFPVKLFPFIPVPIIEMVTVVPFYVVLGVRYSPFHWGWKIPFYWVMVHIAMALEVLALYDPVRIIRYKPPWDLWDSYTWWWIYLLLFEWMGGKMIPSSSRKPIQSKSFRYGRWVWLFLHFILIVTIFLAGFYTGWTVKR